MKNVIFQCAQTTCVYFSVALWFAGPAYVPRLTGLNLAVTPDSVEPRSHS
jgi:hypothetical protein